MSFKEWFFGRPPPAPSEIEEIHDQLVATVADHKRSVDDFQKAAEDLLSRMDVENERQKESR